MDTINILAQIHEGMTVHDHNGEDIGKVAFVQMTDELLEQPGPETVGETAPPNVYEDSFVEDIAEAIDGDYDFPAEVRAKLLREGYIRIDIGFLHRDRFAVPSHIASVSDEKVYLNVDVDQLIANA